jgi:hypothetical protein
MKNSFKVQTIEHQLGHNKVYYFIDLVIFFCVLVGIWGTMSACVDYSVDLVVENRLTIDVKVVYSHHYNDGTVNFVHTSGNIAIGSTGKVKTGIINGISTVPQIVLQAEDSSGKVVWQKTWTGEEFVKLKDVGWIIVISSETND